MSFTGASGESVKLSGSGIAFQLPVPCVGVELGKPLAEDSQFIRGQTLNLAFEIVNLAHSDSYGGPKIVPPVRRGLAG